MTSLPPHLAPVVLLPGLNTTPEVWHPIIRRLTGERRYLLRSCPTLASVEGVADAIAAAAPQRFHLVGYSFGGYVALALLERHPGRLESLVMVGSAGEADNEAQRGYRETCLAAAALGDHERLSEEVAPASLHQTAKPVVLRRYLRMMRAYGRDRYAAHVKACRDRPDRTAVLTARMTPMLFLAGEADRVVSLRRQAASVEAAGAELRIIAGAGHQAPLEQPAAVAEALRIWFATRP